MMFALPAALILVFFFGAGFIDFFPLTFAQRALTAAPIFAQAAQ